MLKTAKSKTEAQSTGIEKKVNTTANAVTDMLVKVNKNLDEQGNRIKKTDRQINDLNKNYETLRTKVDEANETLKKNNNRLEGVSNAANAASQALTALTVGLGFWETFDAFTVQEKAERRLEAAIRANGGAVDELMPRYKEWASSLQNISTQGDETSLQLLQFAESMGISGLAAERAVKNALALSEATGRMGTEVLRATVALEQGSATALGEMIPSIRYMKDETEKAAKAQEILGKMFQTVAGKTGTADKTIKQLSNSWGDFKEQIGSVVAEVLLPLAKILKIVSDEFQQLPEWIKISLASAIILTAGIAGLSAGLLTTQVLITSVTASLGGYTISATAATVATTLLKGALVGVVAFGFLELGKAISGAREKTQKFNEQLQEGQRLNAIWSEKFSGVTQKILAEARKIEDPFKKKNFLQEELDKAKKELNGYKANVNSAKREVEELNTRWNRWTGNKVLEFANEKLEEHNGHLDMARARVSELEQEYNKLRDATSQTFINDNVNKFIEALRKQRQEIVYTTEEIKMMELALMGASDRMLDLVRAEIQLNKQAQDNVQFAQQLEEQLKNVNNAIEDMEASIRGISKIDLVFEKNRMKLIELQTELFNTQKELAKLREEGKGDRNQEEFDKLLQKLIAYEQAVGNATKAQNEINRKLFELKALEEANKLVDEGRKLMEKHKDPFDTYIENVDRLNEMLKLGIINEDTFNKALADQKELLMKVTEEHKKMVREFKAGVTGVDFFSLEGKLRLEELIENQKRALEEGKKIKEQEDKITKGILDAGRRRRERPEPDELDKAIKEALPAIIDRLLKRQGIFIPNLPRLQQGRNEPPNNEARVNNNKRNPVVINREGLDKVVGKQEVTNNVLKEIEKGVRAGLQLPKVVLAAANIAGL